MVTAVLHADDIWPFRDLERKADMQRHITGSREETRYHEHCRSQQDDPDGREPLHPPEPEGRRPELDGGELLADHLFARRPRPRALLEKRADGAALAHLLRQHRDGAVAAVDRTRHAQCRAFRYDHPLCGRAILQSWRSTLLLDRIHQVARRGNLAYLVRYRRAAAHPLAAEPDSRPALRRVHRADPGARHASRSQRRRGNGAILAAGTRVAAILDVGMGMFGKLDGSEMRRGWHPFIASPKRSGGERSSKGWT